MRSLPLFFQLKDRPVILLGQGEAAAAKRALLERAGARIVGEDQQASLAVVAIDEDELALAAIARLKARGVLVNAADRLEHCDFTIPAIVDRDPVIIAIGTGGASAGLAKALRHRLEHILPEAIGTLAESLKRARPSIRERWPEPGDRRRAIDAALEAGGPLDPLASPSPDAVSGWLAAPDGAPISGLKVISLRSDDPDQLTLEQARLLGQADTIVHAADVAAEIVIRGRADATRLRQDTPPIPLPAGLTVQLVREKT
jgi:uroporphyrin-III C-methyltransferase/precorrin-2 dehydrogenase/sirohydrochlorin ferrochelatase